MRVIHIENSYNFWNIDDMHTVIKSKCYDKFGSYNPEETLNRTYKSMYIEWWLHNIGYHMTKPFRSIDAIHKINLRCKDVDLEEWV